MINSFKVLSFGELLLRLSAPGNSKLFQKDSFDISFCGAEANVAVSLAEFGIDSSFVTRIVDSDVGRAAVRSLNYFGVDTSNVIYGDGRMGLYYLEKGVSQRPSNIIYDRENSSIAKSKVEDYDWEKILDGVDWFHWTGINPALSERMPLICESACKEAKNRGITVSCDLNYRSKLWTPEEARAIFPSLMRYVDICICNEEDADNTLGIKPSDTDVETGKLSRKGYEEVAKQIVSRFGCRYVATTLRKSYSASRNGWSSILYDSTNEKSFYSKEYDIQIVDRVGSGDSFAAGLIYAMGQKMECQEVVEFATAASCLKHTIEGDYNRVTVSDVEKLLRSGGNGRVCR